MAVFAKESLGVVSRDSLHSDIFVTAFSKKVDIGAHSFIARTKYIKVPFVLNLREDLLGSQLTSVLRCSSLYLHLRADVGARPDPVFKIERYAFANTYVSMYKKMSLDQDMQASQALFTIAIPKSPCRSSRPNLVFRIPSYLDLRVNSWNHPAQI